MQQLLALLLCCCRHDLYAKRLIVQTAGPRVAGSGQDGSISQLLHLAGMISSNLELHRYATGRKSRVVTAMTLLKSHLFR